MARAARVALFEREIRERLSQAAVEILLAQAQVLSEGGFSSKGGRPAFYGSTMLTIDLGVASEAVRERCDGAAARRAATLIADDPRVTRRVRQVAEDEAASIAGGPLRVTASDVRVRAHGTTLYIDVDLEGEATTALARGGR